MYLSYVSQCINLHSHLGERAKDATVKLQQLRAEVRYIQHCHQDHNLPRILGLHLYFQNAKETPYPSL